MLRIEFGLTAAVTCGPLQPSTATATPKQPKTEITLDRVQLIILLPFALFLASCKAVASTAWLEPAQRQYDRTGLRARRLKADATLSTQSDLQNPHVQRRGAGVGKRRRDRQRSASMSYDSQRETVLERKARQLMSA